MKWRRGGRGAIQHLAPEYMLPSRQHVIDVLVDQVLHVAAGISNELPIARIFRRQPGHRYGFEHSHMPLRGKWHKRQEWKGRRDREIRPAGFQLQVGRVNASDDRKYFG